MTTVPRRYILTPLGLGPNFWRYEQSGLLAGAVDAYLSWSIDPNGFPEPSADILRLLIEYFDYWVNAPCWKGDLEELRRTIKEVGTASQLREWLHNALDEGIDPL